MHAIFPYLIAAGIGGFILFAILLAVMFRVVVETNEVHIVQTGRSTVSYGKDQTAGNVYYAWPSWFPVIGVKTSALPMSVFDVDLDSYEAYDKARVPFKIDVMAFFRIEHTDLAAQRVHTVEELKTQLQGILQGSCRAILASADIETILGGRSEFGEKFTKEVDENLKAWGVATVKTIELMDIRDSESSKVISNIMAKNKSVIERESRVVVADNMKQAETAEIEARRAVDVSKQEAQQLVGQRTAEQEKQVGIARELANQEVLGQRKVTAARTMEVQQVEKVRAAEIEREVQVVAADQQKQTTIIAAEAAKQVNIVNAEGIQKTAIIQAEGEKQQTVIVAEGAKQQAVLNAEGQKQQTVLVAEGDLTKAQLNAKGIEVEGVARGAAEQAILMAPVNTQITLAREIGANEGYQKYLLGSKTIDKDQAVGIAQAEALKAADIKVIANSGDVHSGVTNVMDLLTAKGGTQLGAMVEALAQTPAGASLVKRLNGSGNTAEH